MDAFAGLPACLSVCLSACLSACLPAFLPVCLPACPPVCLPVCPPVCLPARLSPRLQCVDDYPWGGKGEEHLSNEELGVAIRKKAVSLAKPSQASLSGAVQLPAGLAW